MPLIMIIKKIKKMVVSIIFMTLLYCGLIYLDNYLTPKFGTCYQNRNRIPHYHVGPCMPEKYFSE